MKHKQVERLKFAFKRAGLLNLKDKSLSVSVRTVDGCQGDEADVVLLSTVRSNSSGSVGFICDPQRLCVAMTRAKHLMIMVGCAKTLRKSSTEVLQNIVKDFEERQRLYDSEAFLRTIS